MPTTRRPCRPGRLRARRRRHLRFRRSPRHLATVWPPFARVWRAVVGGGGLAAVPSAASSAVSSVVPRALRALAGRPRTAAVALVVGASVAVVVAGPAPAAADDPPGPGTYVPPVDAPVIDPFRPPAGPYGAGNRGLEYGTEPGAPVRASAAGTVTFAGPVGGSLHVTVAHPDGVRTSYSFLATVTVVLGQQVVQGDVVGVAGGPFHFGARRGDAYFDPASLFSGVTHVELLPLAAPPPGASEAEIEARALAELSGGPGLSVPLPDLGDAVDWLHDTVATGLTVPGDLAGRGLALARDLGERLLFPGPCSDGPPPPRPVAGGSRVAVTVGGLGSTGGSAGIDRLRLAELGYDGDRVVRFSYAGGRTPGTGRAFAGVVPARDYRSADTQGDAHAAARHLADLVEQVLAAEPGATVDLYAHSLGGIVTRLAVAELAGRGADLGRLGLVVTLGTPHRGADLATAVVAAGDRLVPRLALDAAEDALDVGIDPGATVVHQLAEGSPLVRRLADEGVPPGVRLVSIAARGDVVAAAPATEVAGAVNVTVPVVGLSAHSDLVSSDAATAEVARALAGQPPGCEAWTSALADVLAGHGISLVEDAAGAALAGAGP
ncbi:MAG TPA: peptidoglycan DD-metalloendopeptidase family protein [Acidimicrobiales bacterium]|nr:peptidoglycan DD-metalloendopeptidase family protein [Acidimicrobiales bacterium]